MERAAGKDRARSTDWPLSGLNRGPNDFQSLDAGSNSQENKAILQFSDSGCSAGCSDVRSEGGISDPDLSRLVATWPTLPPAIRRAMLAMIGAVIQEPQSTDNRRSQ